MPFAEYAAGLFDGEGSVSISRSGDRVWLSVRLSISHRDVLEEFEEHWGGYVRIHSKRCNTVHQWYMHGTLAEDFLTDVLPYLRVKKKDVELGLRFITTIQATNIPLTAELTAARLALAAEMLSLRRYLEDLHERFSDLSLFPNIV